MIVKLCSVLVALKPCGYRMHPTGRGVKVWWKETTHPKEIPSRFCLNSLSLPLCFSPSEVPLLSGNYVKGGKIHFGGSEQLGRHS